MLKYLLSMLVVTLASACTNERKPTSARACFDYALETQPVLDRACLECHSPEFAEGDYSVATPAETFARRAADGVARIEANVDAMFLTEARGNEDHPTADATDLAFFERWLIDCQANTLRTEATHPRGWFNRDSNDFHGAVLRASVWDFDACGECHGAPDDPSGGASGIACTTCHTEGATGCSTCHGVVASEGAPGPALDGRIEAASRGVGAHRIHMIGRLLAPSAQCEDCHVVPANWDDPGHIFTESGAIDEAPAEVILGEAAGRSLEDLEERRTAEPSYDADTGTCSNVYCHAATVGDTTYSAPVWTELSDEPECDTCHGFPPGGTHPEGTVAADCNQCHPLLIGTQTGPSTLDLLDETLHIDGRLALGNGNESCNACHGSSANSAPPLAVNGETGTNDPQVGAHQAHVAANVFRGPIGCEVCHVTPIGESFIDTVITPGHVDSVLPAEAFPTGLGGIGAADGATPNYTSPTCTNTYCHGGGTRHSADTAPEIVRSLDWTDVGNGTVVCGSCHGLPPQTPRHWQTLGPVVPLTINDCALCHGDSVDASGTIIIAANGESTHIDGTVSP